MVLCPWGDYNQVGSSVLRGKHQGTRVAGGGRAEEAIFSSLESSWSGGYLRVAEDGVGALGRVHGTGEVWLRGTGQGGRGAQVGEDRTVGGLETPRPAPHPTTSPPTGDAGQAPALSPVSSRNPRVAPCLLPHRPAEVRGRTLDHGSSESGSLDERATRGRGAQGWVFGVSSGLCHFPSSCPTCRGSKAEQAPCSLSLQGGGWVPCTDYISLF